MGASEYLRGNTNRYRPNHKPETIGYARHLWDHDWSASEIAAQIELSRNAICAIARRNDFAERGSPIKRRTNG
jgi:hypothetical protein